MKDKIKEDNIDNEFTDINKESKSKPYVIVGILYLLVIILSVILILGLKHQKDTINDSMSNENNNPVDKNTNNNKNDINHDDNLNNSQSDNKLDNDTQKNNSINNNINQDENNNRVDNNPILEDNSSILDYIN